MKRKILAGLLAFMGLMCPSQSDAQNGGCIPTSGSKAFHIVDVQVRESNGNVFYQNPSSATPYSDYSATCVPYILGLPGLVFSVTGNQAGHYFAIWIDSNDNNVFEPGELAASGGPTPNATVNFAPSLNTPLGSHLVRVRLGGAPITDPCAPLLSGETEDYCLNFGCVPPTINQNAWIARVFIGTGSNQLSFDNPTGPTPYSDFTAHCVPFDNALPGNVLGIEGSQTGMHYAVYIDLNHDGIFAANELYLQGGPLVSTGVNMNMPGNLQGEHLVRVIMSLAPITGPCNLINSGETEDYCLDFGCNPVILGNGTFISEVRIRDMQTVFFSNPTGANGYSDYTNPCHDYVQGQPGLVFSITANLTTYSFAIWVDENDNGIFEPGELANSGTVNGGNGTINASFGGINPGSHRVRVIVSDTPINGPCPTLQNGEVEDYCLNFGCVPNTLNQNAWISRVFIGTGSNQLTFDNPTGPTPYSDFTGNCVFFDNTLLGNVFGITGSQTGMHYAVYIDLNNDGIFAANELFQQGGPLAGTGVNMNLPGNLQGQHLVRVIMSLAPITGPCDLITSGETEDYCLNFGCNPVILGNGTFISEVRIRDGQTVFFSNPTGANGYSDYTNPCQDYAQGQPGLVFSITANLTTYSFAIWVDENDNGIFEPGELANSGTVNGGNGTINQSFGGIATGSHRVRVIVSDTPINGPCPTLQNGEVEDYCLNFGCVPNTLNQNAWISRVFIGTGPNQLTFDNPTGPSAYSDFTGNCVFFDNTLLGNVLGIAGSQTGMFYAVFIDLDHDGIFAANELFQQGGPLVGTGVNLNLPGNLEGQHLVRVIMSLAPITGPCDLITSGETEDYCLIFPCRPASTSQDAFISNVNANVFGTVFYNNPSGPSSYSNYTANCINFNALINMNLGISLNMPGLYLAVYLDLNDNGIFEANELLNPFNATMPLTGSGGNQVLPQLTGDHLLRIIVSRNPITGPCDDLANGETEDYRICYPCEPPVSMVQSIWINRVRVTSGLGMLYNNLSGASAYSSYLNPCITVPAATTVNIGVGTTMANRNVAIYIDYNGDGFFGNNELHFNGLVPALNLVVPLNTSLLSGTNLMRIVYSTMTIVDPCEDVPNGEIEDYLFCLDGGRGGKTAEMADGAQADVQQLSLNLYPQPARDHVTLAYSISRDEAVTMEVRDIQGRLLMTPLTAVSTQAGSHTLEIPSLQLSSGLYLVTLRTATGSKTSKLVIE